MSATSLRRKFAVATLNRLGIRPTPQNVKALVGWSAAEGGHTNNDARWNFLNTTQNMPGSGDTGTQGNISVYRDFNQGVDATVKTLRNGRYGGILQALKSGTPEDVARAIDASPWGTHGSLVYSAISGTPPQSTAGGRVPGGNSQPQVQRQDTTLKQVQGFDQSGYERAQKLAFLGAMIAQRDPSSVLVKLGVTPTSAPNPVDFQTSQLRAVTTTKPARRQKQQPAAWSKGHVGSFKLHELFYNGPGGVNVKEGQVEPTGFVSGHTDHVHVAAQTRGETERLARLAQRMGLTVRELAPFDKVDPVHTTNSWHYAQSGAADVSGAPDLMRKYSRKVARKAGLL